MDITLTVCDICKDEKTPAVESFDITRGRASRHLDLCEKHAATLIELFDQGSTVSSAPKQRTRRGGTRTLTVTSLEDIEKMKHA